MSDCRNRQFQSLATSIVSQKTSGPKPCAASTNARKRLLVRKPPSPTLLPLCPSLQLCQLRQILPRIPSIVEHGARAVDSCDAILHKQLVQVAPLGGDDDAIDAPKRRTPQGTTPARIDGIRCGELSRSEGSGFRSRVGLREMETPPEYQGAFPFQLR